MIAPFQIPVSVEPGRLAERTGASAERIEAALTLAGGALSPTGVFDEVRPEAVWANWGEAPPDLGETVIVGLCSLGAPIAAPNGDEPLWTALLELALADALDYIEYRLRRYLAPAGRKPGPRLTPGCPLLPIEANQAIMDHFGPDDSLGLTASDSGEVDFRTGCAFLYPAVERPAEPSRCDACKLANCPSRLTSA